MDTCHTPPLKRRALVLFGLCLIIPLTFAASCSSSGAGVGGLEFVEDPRTNLLADVTQAGVGAQEPPSTPDPLGDAQGETSEPDVAQEDASGPALADGSADTGSTDVATSEDGGALFPDGAASDADAAQGDVEGSGSADASEVEGGDELDADASSPLNQDSEAIEDSEGPLEDTEDAESDAPAEDTVEEGDALECGPEISCPAPESPCHVVTCVDGSCEESLAPLGTQCAPDDDQGEPACLQGSCSTEGLCVSAVLTGMPCDDGDPCTTDDTCTEAGLCQGGGATKCPSTGPCEIGLCDSLSGCVSLPVADGLLCDDGDPCTVQTSCELGVCAGGDNLCACLEDADCYEDGDLCNGTPICVDLPNGGKGCQIDPESLITCAEPADPCLTALCVPEDGSCIESVLVGASCDDGELCTQNDVCDDAGGCAGLELVCDDGVPCTGDGCEEGLCVFTSLDGAPCDDGEPCTVQDTCLDAGCAGQAKSCDDQDPCTLDSCDPETGVCVNLFEEGALCDDGSACTEGDSCSQGVCVGIAFVCDDDNVCTDDGCDPASGCVHEANSLPCPDGSACTGPDLCVEGVCDSSEITCDDGIACTLDSCDPAQGCVYTPNSGACDDENPCTSDTCITLEGCTFVPNTLACDDGSPCTFADQCAGGLCKGEVVLCNDGVGCTLDSCDEATGTCISTPDDGLCDDDNPCTLTGCDAESGCVSVNADGDPCDDEVACTEGDLCEAGVCVPGANVCPCALDADCDDANACNGVYACQETLGGLTECVASVEPVVCSDALDTPCLVNTCQPSSGECDLVALADETPCTDSDACTVNERCLDGECDAAQLACDDGIACTLDTCEPELGCVHTPLASACDDGVACTLDACLALSGCVYEPQNELCDDAVACTQDSCLLELGCQNLEASAPCDDGVACTLDVCDPSEGCFSLPDDAACNDDNPCTSGLCLNEGCVVAKIEGPCEDGNPCTAGDQCSSGACAPGAPVDCEDGDLCTKDVCSPVDGTCVTSAQPEGTSCEDGSECTEADSCVDGACESGAEKLCDDAVPCTVDSCDPNEGCVYSPDDSACDDGNPCTDDLCVPGQGCTYMPRADFSPCDDGVNGTAPDVCVEGLCRGGQNTALGVPTLWCEVNAARLSRVSSFEGSVYALMTYTLSGILCGTVPCAEGGGFCHSRVIRLNEVNDSSVANLGGTLSGLSHDAVVGAGGQVGQLAVGGFTVLWSWSDLAGAIGDAGLTGGVWHDVWATELPEDGGSAYTLVGRSSDTGPGRVVNCRLEPSASSCEPATLDFDEWGWDVLDPVAVEGVLSGAVALPVVAVQGTGPGAPSGLWLTEDGDDFSLHPLGPDLSVAAALRPSPERAWLFGADSLSASFEAEGWVTWPAGIEGLTLRASARLGELMLTVGDDPSSGEAWLLTRDLNEASTESDDWRVAPLGIDRRAYDIYADAEGITIVGAEIIDDGSTRPFLWFIKL